MAEPSLLQNVYDKVCRLEEILTGDGEPSKGMVVRVDRLEQTVATIRKIFWLIIGGLSTSVGTVLYYLFTRG